MFFFYITLYINIYNRLNKYGSKVSKKSAFPTNVNILTVFNGILWIRISLQNVQNLTPVFLCSSLHFLSAIENRE